MTSFRIALLISLLTLGFAAPVIAESGNPIKAQLDIADDADRAPPSDPTRPQVHNPAGGFFVESHADFACTDCHTYITNLEHDMLEGDPQVDCLECHDEVPTKE